MARQNKQGKTCYEAYAKDVVQSAIDSSNSEETETEKCTGTSIDQAALLVENTVDRSKVFLGQD